MTSYEDETQTGMDSGGSELLNNLLSLSDTEYLY